MAIYNGTAGNDTLTGDATDDSLSGAGGDDTLSGAAGNDTLNGGADTWEVGGFGGPGDWLSGGSGNDTYLFGVGSGHDTISEYGIGSGGSDKVVFSGLKRADVSFEKNNAYDLTATITSTGESLFITNAFASDINWNVETFVFKDSTLSLNDLNTQLNTGGSGDDSIWGWTGNDTLDGGADTWEVGGFGGPGDWLSGGAGNDTYLFGVGSGHDTISEYGNGNGGNDKVVFTNLKKSDVSFSKINNVDLVITINATGEWLSITNEFSSDTNWSIEKFKFSDTELNLNQVKNLAEHINHLPTGTVSIDDTTPEQFQILTATNTLDDIDGLGTITYTWSANNTVLGVGASYTVSADDLGKKISVTASYTDALGNFESVSSTTTKAVVLAKLNLNGTSGNDLLSGGGSNDTLSGNAGNDLLDGDFGDDILNGGDGDDLLNGGAGKDILNGNAGTDILRGSYGKDTFIFNSELDGTIDTLADFRAADDTIKLENAIFTQLNKTGTLKAEQFVIAANALDANDYIIYTPSTGALSYDADGNGAGASVQFAVVGVNLALTNVDFVVI